MSDQPMFTDSHEATEPSPPLVDDFGDFNNTPQTVEISNQPAGSFSNYSVEATSHLSDDFSNSSSSEVAELTKNLQGVTMHTHSNIGQQGDTASKPVHPVLHEATGSRSKTESSVDRDGKSSSRETFREDGVKMGSSLQEVVGLISFNQAVIGATASHHMFPGSAPLSSDESDESLESVGNTGSSPINRTGFGSDSDRDESLESASSILQQETGSNGPTTISPLMNPDHDTRNGSGADKNMAVPDQDVGTRSKEATRSFSQGELRLNSASSEESQGTGAQEGEGSTASVQGSVIGGSGSGAEVRSSSEEVMLAPASSSPVGSPQTPNVSGSFSSESDSQGAESGNKSQRTQLPPDPIPTSHSDADQSPESIFSPISQKDSEESSTINVPTDAYADARREAKPAEYIPGASPVSSDISINANTEAVGELSVEEYDDASPEATTDSVTSIYNIDVPDYRASSDANAKIEKKQAGIEISAEANPEASSPGPKLYASSEENMASPPPRRKPYRFGFLGPIIHFYSDRLVARETKKSGVASPTRATTSVRHNRDEMPQDRNNQNINVNPLDFFRSWYDAKSRQTRVNIRKPLERQLRVTMAAAAHPVQSSSEESK